MYPEGVVQLRDKQHFLNTVYERFFQGYSIKTADTHGIVYTPQPIVDFMCASVEEVLKSEFGLTVGSPDNLADVPLFILDKASIHEHNEHSSGIL